MPSFWTVCASAYVPVPSAHMSFVGCLKSDLECFCVKIRLKFSDRENMVKQGMKAANLSQDQNLLFNKLQSLIDQHQSFIITTHVVPDGDGLGGEVALSA